MSVGVDRKTFSAAGADTKVLTYCESSFNVCRVCGILSHYLVKCFTQSDCSSARVSENEFVRCHEISVFPEGSGVLTSADRSGASEIKVGEEVGILILTLAGGHKIRGFGLRSQDNGIERVTELVDA